METVRHRPGAPRALPGGRRRQVVLPEAGAEVGAGLAHHHGRLHAQRHHQRRPGGGRPRPPPVGREPGLPRLPRVAEPAARPRGGRRAPRRPRPVARASMFEQLQEGAVLAHELLDELGIEAHIKTSGSRGLHLYVGARAAMGQLRGAGGGGGLARELERRHPDRITAAWWKEERGSRVFVDFNQNAPHKTVFGAWCVRPARRRPGVHADRVGRPRRRSCPDELTIATVPARLAERGNAVGGDVRPAPGPHAAARAVGPRPRQRAPGRAVATRVPEDAARAAEGRPEPRPRNLTRGSRSRSAGPLAAVGRQLQGDTDDRSRRAHQPVHRRRRRGPGLAGGELGSRSSPSVSGGSASACRAGRRPACPRTPTARA